MKALAAIGAIIASVVVVAFMSALVYLIINILKDDFRNK